MTTKQIDVQRFSVTSAKSFEEVMAGLEAGIGHPDMNAFRRDVSTAKTYAELEKVIHKVIGSSGLMEFTRFDLGEILRKERGKEGSTQKFASCRRQSAHHETDGRACAGCGFVRSSDDSDRRAS